MQTDDPEGGNSEQPYQNSVEEEFGTDTVYESDWHFCLNVIEPDEPVIASRNISFDGGCVRIVVELDQHEPLGKFMLVEHAVDTLIFAMRGNPV